MKKCLALFALLFLSVHIIAQTQLKDDVVYLKNGSVVRGQLIELNTNEKVKIKTYGGNVWVFNYSEIDKIVKEAAWSQNMSGDSTVNLYSSSKYFNSTEFGVLAGVSNSNTQAPFSIHMINGMDVTSKIGAGLGVGLEFYTPTLAPVFFEFRYRLRTSGMVPFLYGRSGYSFVLGNDDNEMPTYYYSYGTNYKGGITYGSGLGVNYVVNNNTAISFTVGYRFQQIQYKIDDYYSEGSTVYEKYQRLEIKLGIFFK